VISSASVTAGRFTARRQSRPERVTMAVYGSTRLEIRTQVRYIDRLYVVSGNGLPLIEEVI